MMPARPPFPTRAWMGRLRFSPVDVVVAVGTVVLLWGLIRLDQAMGAPSARLSGSVSLAMSHLPYYAARSLLRMFIAYALSLLFTFVYGTAAARSRRWRGVLIVLLDILQSVPVLGFLAITVTFFVGLFPGSELGLECAAIFAIFTSQAWNMTFSFYHSLITQPTELDEAARIYRLTKWQRFWKLDVPSSMIGLVWNAMMSMGGGWFFLTASEAISVSGKGTTYLPGIGSYIGTAQKQGSLAKVTVAIVVMVVMVVGVNFLVFRPLVAWAEKFRMESSEATDKPRSVVLDVWRHSRIPGLVRRMTTPVAGGLDRVTRPFGLAEHPLVTDPRRRRAGDVAFWSVIVAVVGWGAVAGFTYLVRKVGLHAFAYAAALGSVTFLRVIVVVVVSTLVWVPVGVKIGLSPRLSRYAQPVVQILASFPSNLLFPFAIVVFLAIGLPLDEGSVVLMAVGAQWYILFNAIAGAIAIPNDLREMATNLRLTRRQRWRSVLLPAVFPAYVTGGVTAAGGAWNATIVAEVVVWGRHHLSATGLGAYITNAAASSGSEHFAKVLAGVVVMSLFVVFVNRLFWRRLYRLAETRCAL